MGKTKKTQLELCVQEGEEKQINLFVFPIQFNIMAVSILKTPVKLHLKKKKKSVYGHKSLTEETTQWAAATWS